MTRVLSRRAAIAVTVGAMVAGVPAMASAAARSGTHGWRVTATYGHGADNVGAAGEPSDALEGLSAVGPSSAWSLWWSCTWPCTGATTETLRHWNGHLWSAAPASTLHGLEPAAVAASSQRDAWLVGSGWTMHWNGSAWSKQTAPRWIVRNNLSGEVDIYPADFSRSDFWIFSLGDTAFGHPRPYAARYFDGRWTKNFLPAVPSDATAVSANDIWAMSESGSPARSATVMRWNGHRWTRTMLPEQPSKGYVYGLTATGPASVWGVWADSAANSASYLLHWTSGGWHKVSLPAGDSVLTMTGDGHGGLWVAGVGAQKSQPQLFLHWSRGRWTTTHVPSAPGLQLGQVDQMTVIPGTDSVWGTGHLYGPGGGTTLNRGAIWRYDP